MDTEMMLDKLASDANDIVVSPQAAESHSSITWHVLIEGRAACGARLARERRRSLESVPSWCQCQRAACKRHWPVPEGE